MRIAKAHSRLTMIRIEPDWNVKCTLAIFLSALMFIRIEPDWNVKLWFPKS